MMNQLSKIVSALIQLNKMSFLSGPRCNKKKAQREKQHSALCYLVSVPVVGGRVDSLPLVSLQQLLRVPDTHRASDDLSDVWHQHVDLQHRHTDRTIVRLVS